MTSLTTDAEPSTADRDLLDRAFDLTPNVAVRPEQFGALLYHFGTRRLSFLKDRRLLALVQALADAGTVREACQRVGIGPHEQPTYARSLQTLLATEMLTERPPTASRPEPEPAA